MKTLKLMKASSAALLLASAAAFTVIPMSWDAAQAKNGQGNGGKRPVATNGGGHGGGNTARTERRGGGKPDHTRTRTRATEGETTEETTEAIRERLHRRTLETETRERQRVRTHDDGTTREEWEHPASHASATGFANASPNSRLGRIAAARAERDAALTTEDELSRLTGLTDDEIAEEFPDGGYGDALSDAVLDVVVETPDTSSGVAVDTNAGTSTQTSGILPTFFPNRADSH